MYNEHLHGDGMVSLGLLKPGGRMAHRFYVLAMARRHGGGEGGESGEGSEGGERGEGGEGGGGASGARAQHGSRRTHERTDGERVRARRARKAAARGRAGGEAT